MKPSDIREMIPAEGLREYWYPALHDRDVGRKPVQRQMLGEKLAFFRDEDGSVVAVTDVCPHRGASMAEGDMHYPGTIACPYHGWVFNAKGDCIAVLSEGPDSRIPGKVTIRTYPTRTLKGMVFVWMGEQAPAAIEEDVPPEFFEGPDTLVLTSFRMWPVNWRLSLENSLDSHVMYVHRDALLQLREPVQQFGRFGYRPRVVNDRACLGYLSEQPIDDRQYYPALKAYWPKSNWRKYWLWFFRWKASLRKPAPPFNDNDEWDMNTTFKGKRVRSGGHHLPSMFRFQFGDAMYTRACIPTDANNTRIAYYHSVRRPNPLSALWERIWFRVFHDWAMNTNFSDQDYQVMEAQRYDTPEKLSGTDAQVIAWRKLLLRARGMPDNVLHPGGPGAETVYEEEAPERAA